MKKTILIFLIGFLSYGQSNKEKSYIKFVPEFHKDTLQIINIDSLKYDLDVAYSDRDSTFYILGITGQLGIINKYDLMYLSNGVEGFHNSSVSIGLYLNGRRGGWRIKKTDFNNPYFLDFKCSGRIIPVNSIDKIEFSSYNLKKFIDNLQFRIYNFRLGNSGEFIFINEKANESKNININTLKVLFSKNDIQYINVYKNRELILKMTYEELLLLEE